MAEAINVFGPRVNVIEVVDSVSVVQIDVGVKPTVEIVTRQPKTIGVSSGSTGAPGPQGQDGPRGEGGPQGEDGPQGPQGVRGLQGLIGVAGPAGLQGLQGDQGVPGSLAFTIEQAGTLIRNQTLFHSLRRESQNALS